MHLECIKDRPRYKWHNNGSRRCSCSHGWLIALSALHHNHSKQLQSRNISHKCSHSIRSLGPVAFIESSFHTSGTDVWRPQAQPQSSQKQNDCTYSCGSSLTSPCISGGKPGSLE